MKRELVILFLAVFSINLAFATEFPSYADKYVNDFASILSQEQTSQLRASLIELEQNTTVEFVIVTIPNCSITASEYANKLFSQWKVGKADIDNGLMALYCKDTGKIWVEVGYGLEGVFPDSKVGRFLDDYYVPLRDQGNTPSGIVLFSLKTIEELEKNSQELTSGQVQKKVENWKIIIFFLLVFFIIPTILRIIFRKKIKDKKKTGGFWDALFWMWVGSNIGRSSGGGGFSSGGFGGGMSGGGGAGR